MSLSAQQGWFDSWTQQLSLLFPPSTPSFPFKRTEIADQIHAITSWKFTFHLEKSEIKENTFTLKISYMGSSYSLEWIYKKEEILSSYERGETSTIFRFVRFDKLLAYRNGSYNIPAVLPKIAYDEIIKNANNILSGYHNYSYSIH